MLRGVALRTAAFLTAVLLTVASSSARAATVSVVPVPDTLGSSTFHYFLQYDAEAGEANQVLFTASHDAGTTRDRVRTSDPGASVTAGIGCSQVDAHTADCFLPTYLAGGGLPLESYVVLGDGDDSAEAVLAGFQGSWMLDMRGEDGDDRLIAPSSPYVRGALWGGPGNDVLHGLGAGGFRLDGGLDADEIVGGRGGDTLVDGDPDAAPSRDTIDGGGGRLRDVLSYRHRNRPVRIDLVAGRGGGPGEDDVLTGIEHVVAGAGNDIVRGGPRAESLDGGDGNDLVSGRGGADRLTVGNRDRAAGGPGNDYLAVSGFANIACGAGAGDQVEEVERRAAGPYLARDCELIVHDPFATDTPTGILADPRVSVSRAGVLRMRLRCGGCDRSRLELTRPRAPFKLLADASVQLRLPPGMDFGDDYARGLAVLPLPPGIATDHGTLVRFVVRGGRQRAVWTARLP